MRILVVEDDSVLAAALTRALNQSAYAVDLAKDGKRQTSRLPRRRTISSWREKDPVQARQSLAHLYTAVERMSRLVSQLLSLARNESAR